MTKKRKLNTNRKIAMFSSNKNACDFRFNGELLMCYELFHSSLILEISY